jgi:ABC-type multidrug transport system fused ATPase/permease subunit
LGQALRGYLFKKLLSADYKFLKRSDPSILSRLIFFEFQALEQFIAVIPAFLSSPIAISLSAGLVIMTLFKLNWWMMTLATLVQIFLFLIMLNLLNIKVMTKRDEYSETMSVCSIKLQELIANINNIRVNSFEKKFYSILEKLRFRAEGSLTSIHRSNGFIEFILILTPFLFSSVIVVLFNSTSENRIETSQTMTVISMMVAVTIPLRAFSDSLKKFRVCQVAYRCTSKFFEVVIENAKGSCYRDDDGVRNGEVSWIDCHFVSDDGISVKKITDAFKNAKNISRSKSIRQNSKSKSQGEVEAGTKHVTLVKSRSRKMARVFPELKQTSSLAISEMRTVLKGISFGIRKGEKICVIGLEGCGKEDLFLGILGELNMISGIFKLKGKVAMLDMMNPKFLRGTIRKNIIMGDEFYPAKFGLIVRKVGLNLKKYPGKDLTEIVEGQRNVSFDDQKKLLLARLLYKDADIILINRYFDFLSKDQQQPVFEKIIRQYLRNKTVIYISNVNLLTKLCDRIFVMKQGQIIEKGKATCTRS